MTSVKQRDELQSTIWKTPNEVRGAVDGWDYKQFVLGNLFYRFISENFTDYIEGDDDSIDYGNMSDDVVTIEIKDDAIKTKGYFIYPSQLFVNIAKGANANTKFINASGEEFFKKETNNNVLTDEHIAKIINIFDKKELVEYVATSVDNSKIEENDYNLSVSSYIEAEDKREVIDIVKVNAEIAQTVKRIDALRADIDAIIKEIEG